METEGKKKTSDFFKKGDVIVYAALLLVVILSFLLFFASSSEELKRIEIKSLESGETLFSYNIANGNVAYDESVVLLKKTDEGLEVTIKREESENVVIIEPDGKTYMKEANCSLRKDCVKSGAITRGGDAIICIPNKIEIIGIGNGEGGIIIG